MAKPPNDSKDQQLVAAAQSGTFETKPAAPQRDASGETIGGFAFFLSLFALLPTGLILSWITILEVRPVEIRALECFAVAAAFGALLGHFFIRGRLSVFIHETKHAILSNFAGNRRKGMRVDANSGHFVYSYTKKTAHLNALISLAPYILPLFTVVGALVALALLRDQRLVAVALVGTCYGVDLVLNIRDISPIQSDISDIRGGYGVGLLYIFAWNLAIFAPLLAWILQGSPGVLLLLQRVTNFFMSLYLAVSDGGQLSGDGP